MFKDHREQRRFESYSKLERWEDLDDQGNYEYLVRITDNRRARCDHHFKVLSNITTLLVAYLGISTTAITILDVTEWWMWVVFFISVIFALSGLTRSYALSHKLHSIMLTFETNIPIDPAHILGDNPEGRNHIGYAFHFFNEKKREIENLETSLFGFFISSILFFLFFVLLTEIY